MDEKTMYLILFTLVIGFFLGFYLCAILVLQDCEIQCYFKIQSSLLNINNSSILNFSNP